MNTSLRVTLFVLKKLTSIVIIVLLIVLATFIAYDCSNIYVVLNEGMNRRAEVVLSSKDIASLNSFFTPNFISTDPLINDNPYEQYTISDYDFRLKIKWLWAWPWDRTAKATIQESMPKITGKLSDPEQGSESKPPKWQNGEKIVLLKKDSGDWKIDKLIFKSSIDSFKQDSEAKYK